MVLFRNFSSFTKRVIVSSSIFLYCLFTSAVLPQSPVSILVSESYFNAKVISKQSIDKEHRLLFYNDGKDLLFVNEWVKANTQSNGRVFDITINTNIIHFKWAWKNSYDNKTGIADVYINNLNYRPCRVVIITDTMDVLDYRGTLYGSLEELFIQNSTDTPKPRSENNKAPTNKQKKNTPSLKKWK